MASKATNTSKTTDEEIVSTVEAVATTKSTKETKKEREFKPDDKILVKNNVMGPLCYESSRRDGFSIYWDHFGDGELIPFSELQTMRNTQRRFFEEQWVYIEDADVIRALGVERWYKNMLTSDNFDTLFKMSPDEIISRVEIMSQSMKENVRHRALQLINQGKLDSMKRIRALNQSLDCDLFSE